MNMKKSFQYYVRALHRDLGFLTAGLVIIYALSGILLIYRNTSLLQRETTLELPLAPNLPSQELPKALAQALPKDLSRTFNPQKFQLLKQDSLTITFAQGQYSKITGQTSYTTSQTIPPLDKFISLHMASAKNPVHYLTVLFGVALLLLAASSPWMFKVGTRQFKRGIVLTLCGAAAAITLLVLA